MITKLTIKSYLQLFSLKNYSVKALFTLILSIKEIITLNLITFTFLTVDGKFLGCLTADGYPDWDPPETV